MEKTWGAESAKKDMKCIDVRHHNVWVTFLVGKCQSSFLRGRVLILMRRELTELGQRQPARPNWVFVKGNHQLGVSKNRGTPKWMVFDGKPY